MEQSPLHGSVALVTGASQGIGAAIADALAANGCSLFLVARNEDRLRRVARGHGRPTAGTERKTEVFSTDLARPAAPAEIVERLRRSHGRLDFLVNNAGIAEHASFEDTSLDMFERHMVVNARAPFFLTRECLPLLRASERATVVNIASVVAHEGYPGQSAYGASKHALLGWTKAAARELAPEGIRFHVVSPGGVSTPMIEAVRPEISESELMSPEDIAAAIVFILSRRTTAVIDELRIRRAASRPFG